jgi:FemAB-related protein (PEP-CTERM system-associated)
MHQAAAPAVTIETSADEWTRYVLAQPRATGYHEWPWRHVFQDVFGHRPYYLAARRHGAVTGVLPLVELDSFLFGHSLVSLPFVNYGGVLADDEAAAAALLASASELAREQKCGHVELRHTAQQFPHLPCKHHKVGMLLGIAPAEGLWDRLDRKVRNQIRKAQKSNLVHEAGGPELLDDFYGVFARNMRDLGTPVYPRRLFERVMATFPDRTEIHVVRKEGMPVAAGLTYRTNGATEVPWASSIRDFNPMCPNHLLYWGIIERAAALGCHTLDFGRSTPGEGTYKFKEQWGAGPVPFCWEYHLESAAALPDSSPKNPKFELAISLWKRLPLAVANRIGPAIVRSIP